MEQLTGLAAPTMQAGRRLFSIAARLPSLEKKPGLMHGYRENAQSISLNAKSIELLLNKLGEI